MQDTYFSLMNLVIYACYGFLIACTLQIIVVFFVHSLRRFQAFKLIITLSSIMITLHINRLFFYGERAFAYNQLCQYQKALADLDKAIALKPKAVWPYRDKSMNYVAMGNIQQGLSTLELPLQFHPNEPEIYYFRSFIYRYIQDYQTALFNIEKALSINPRNPTYYGAKGYILTQLKEYQAALAAYDQAIALPNTRKNVALLYHDRGLPYIAMGDMANAITNFEIAIKLSPRRCCLQWWLFWLLLCVDPFKSSQEDYIRQLQNIIKLPTDFQTRISTSALYWFRGQYQQALQILSTVPGPRLGEADYRQLMCYVALHRDAEALETLLHLRTQTPLPPIFYNGLRLLEPLNPAFYQQHLVPVLQELQLL
uniref:Uncharacterized protein n=1 Tax=Thermosporothrix sp. COM3 TaxID=2490863 RepID=A0A455STS7_9CHLR|nr:hypothetical protein KTC_33050 [Thermosporothrix sp. COM3]